MLVEKAKGKGNAVRRLLRDVDADWFVMVDGITPMTFRSCLKQLSAAVGINLIS